jgi:pimeloyl-ACP methyl ester carboxylesterase
MARDSLNNLSVFKYFFYPFSLFVSNKYSPKNYISEIKSPLLLIHGEADQIVDSYHSKELVKLNDKARLWLVKDKSHLEIFKGQNLKQELLDKINLY